MCTEGEFFAFVGCDSWITDYPKPSSMTKYDREGREAQMYTVRFLIGGKNTFTSGIVITIPPESSKRALLNILSDVTY